MADVKPITLSSTGKKGEYSASDTMLFPLLSAHPSTNPPNGYVYVYGLTTDKHIYQKTDVGTIIDLAAVGAGGGDALTTSPLSQFASTTSAQLAAVLSDETGTGKVVYSSSPVISDPAITLNDLPTAPAADRVELYGSKLANATSLSQIDQHGSTYVLQNSLYASTIGIWLPPGNVVTVPGVFGLAAPTVVGTATARAIATTNIATRRKRLGYVSAATAAALAEQRITTAYISAGSASATYDGSGFKYITQWVPSNAAAVTGERFFIGLSSTTAAATNVEPSTLLNQIGIAQLSTDATQYYLVYGGSAAQTAVPLGTAFGDPTAANVLYQLAIYAPQKIANTFYVEARNLNTGASFTQTLTGAATVIPQSTTLLAHKAWKTNNATALAVGFDIACIYFENR